LPRYLGRSCPKNTLTCSSTCRNTCRITCLITCRITSSGSRLRSCGRVTVTACSKSNPGCASVSMRSSRRLGAGLPAQRFFRGRVEYRLLDSALLVPIGRRSHRVWLHALDCQVVMHQDRCVLQIPAANAAACLSVHFWIFVFF
jgi:hypothetical protein